MSRGDMIGFVFQNNCSECHVEARVKARVLLEKGREFLSASLCSVLLATQAMLLMPPSFLVRYKSSSLVFAYIPGVPGNWQGGGGRRVRKTRKCTFLYSLLLTKIYSQIQLYVTIYTQMHSHICFF